MCIVNICAHSDICWEKHQYVESDHSMFRIPSFHIINQSPPNRDLCTKVFSSTSRLECLETRS